MSFYDFSFSIGIIVGYCLCLFMLCVAKWVSEYEIKIVKRKTKK
jgi:hypothetical protein